MPCWKGRKECLYRTSSRRTQKFWLTLLTFHRFLWVVLQLDALCKNDIETDESIRRSLQDMPRDSYGLFRRILHRANVTGSAFQNRLLKILVAAQRPLTMDELREALSVVPADATWKPQQQINDITNALRSCGSLITVDEEEDTVSFVHQGVPQSLIQGADNNNPSEWHFTSHEASMELGQLLVTYLSYGVFDQQLSTFVVPNISAGQAPTTVIQHVLTGRSWKKTAALKLLRFRSQHDPDLGRAITEASGAYQRSSETREVFHLLAYAREYWLFHTRAISSESRTFRLWKDLLAHPKFGWKLGTAYPSNSQTSLWGLLQRYVELHKPYTHLPTYILQLPKESLRVKGYWTDIKELQPRYIVCRCHPKILWAITNSHLGCLSLELMGKNGLRGLCGVVVYLLALKRCRFRPKLDKSMWEKLGKCAKVVGMKGLSHEIFQLCQLETGRLTEQHNLQDLHLVEKAKAKEKGRLALGMKISRYSTVHLPIYEEEIGEE